MRIRLAAIFTWGAFLLFFIAPLSAQDLGPHFRKIQEGIYVYSAKPADFNAGIILTQDGVVLIDSGHNPPDSRAVLSAVKKLTSQPVRFLLRCGRYLPLILRFLSRPQLSTVAQGSP